MGGLRTEVGPKPVKTTNPVPARRDWDFLAITFRLMAGLALWMVIAANLRPAAQQPDPVLSSIQGAAGCTVFALSLVGLAVLRKPR